MSNTNRFFNQIQLSSVSVNKSANSSHNDSLIHQLDLFESQINTPYKVDSFVYAEVPHHQMDLSNKTPSKNPKATNRYQHRQVYQKGSYENESNSAKRSVHQQIIDENKKLELKLQHRFRGGIQQQKIRQYISKGQCLQNQKASIANNQRQADIAKQFIERLQEQYTSSNVIRLYNFIMKEIPSCSKCQMPKDHMVRATEGVKLICRKCSDLCKVVNSQSLMGVLYDLQNKGRFEQELNIYQSCLEMISKQIEKMKDEIQKIEALKDKIVSLKTLSRKKFKQITEAKFYIKKHIDHFAVEHLQHLQKVIPDQYIEQMELWRAIELSKPTTCPAIDSQLNRLIPVHIHQHSSSKVLSALHKILNYQSKQEVKISVSEPIKIPIKRMQKIVLVVDGSYSLPVFDEVGHLHLQFQNKKTKRQLNILFSNFPRVLDSLSFSFNHKIHSHISAQSFPFLQYIAPLSSIRHLQITISNAKELGDILKLPEMISPKRQLKLKISRHLFSQQQLILPHNYYDRLISKLGPELQKLELQFPESVDSQAILDYEKYISSNQLLKLKIKRGEKDDPGLNHRKILDQSGQKRKVKEKQQEIIFRNLKIDRIRFVILARKMGPLSEQLLHSVFQIL